MKNERYRMGGVSRCACNYIDGVERDGVMKYEDAIKLLKRIWAVKYFTDLLMLSKEDAEKIVDDHTEEELDELFAALAADEEN